MASARRGLWTTAPSGEDHVVIEDAQIRVRAEADFDLTHQGVGDPAAARLADSIAQSRGPGRKVRGIAGEGGHLGGGCVDGPR